MADEQVIGVAQLRLEAEIADFEAGMKKAGDTLREGEANFAKFTEKGEKEGARLLSAQKMVNDEILNLTGTATQRQLAQVDERTNRIIASARKRGASEEEINRLEIASFQRKHAILVAEEKRGQTAITATTVASGNAHAAFNKTQVAVQHLGTAFGGASGEAGKVATALGHLSAGASGVGIAIGLAALAVSGMISKHQTAAKEAEAHAAKMEEWGKKIKRLRLEIADLRTGGDSAKFFDEKEAVDEATKAVTKWADLTILAGKGVGTLTAAENERLGAAGRAEGFMSDYLLKEEVARTRMKEALVGQRLAIDALNDTLTKEREGIAEANALKTHELQLAKDKKKIAEDDKALLDAGKEQAEWEKSAAAELYEFEKASDAATEAQKRSVEATKDRVLASIACGNALDYEVEAIEQMGEKQAAAVADAKALAAANRELADAAAASAVKVAAKDFSEAEGIKRRNELYDSGMKQVDIAAKMEEEGYAVDQAADSWGGYLRAVEQSLEARKAWAAYELQQAKAELARTLSYRAQTSSTGLTYGVTDAQGLYAMATAAHARVNTATANARELGLSVTINNNHAGAGVAITARKTQTGLVIETVGEDLLNGGDVSRILEDTYGLQRGGSGL